MSDFYRSIYTHSFEWALVSKSAAKAQVGKKKNLLGAALDTAVRNGQDGQTGGIPVGPNTSLLLAEIILTAVDVQMVNQFPQLASSATRLVDDVEFAAQTRSQAEDYLYEWDRYLNGFDLSVNSAKTVIAEGQSPPEQAWRIALSQFRVRDESEKALSNDLYSLLTLGSELAKEYTASPVLTYVIRKVDVADLGESSWPVYFGMLMATITREPSSLRIVEGILSRANKAGKPIDVEILTETLNAICVYHAPLGHGSEVAGSLTILRRFNLKVEPEAAALVAQMDDNASLILLQDMTVNGLVRENLHDMSRAIAKAEHEFAYKSEDWLLGYEFARNGWASPVHFEAQPEWKELREAGVIFYRPFRAGDLEELGGSTPAPAPAPAGEVTTDGTTSPDVAQSPSEVAGDVEKPEAGEAESEEEVSRATGEAAAKGDEKTPASPLGSPTVPGGSEVPPGLDRALRTLLRALVEDDDESDNVAGRDDDSYGD